MKGDFSRLDFNPADNYTGVLYQQGRVSTDADGNAETAIEDYLRTTLTQDAIGPNVAAVPAAQPEGFMVTQAQASATEVSVRLQPGRLWANGLPVVLPGAAAVTRKATYLGPPIQSPEPTPGTIAVGVSDAVVLEVSEQAFSGFQDPQHLIEPALGGPDTTERVKVSQALRLLRLDPGEDCGNLADRLADNFDAKGRLTVTPAPSITVTGDCPVEAGGGYSGFEHFLYRIEIAEPHSDGSARFKWSQFNGGLVGRGEFSATGATTGTLAIKANNTMINHCGLTGFYVEALSFDPGYGHWRVVFSADAALQPDMLTLTNTVGTWPATVPGTGFFRLWNEIRFIGDSSSSGGTELKDGIRLAFEPDALGKYLAGDYWVFPVRAAGVPIDAAWIAAHWPNNAPPQGVHYHRVPLAILNWDAVPPRSVTAGAALIEDCRQVFQPLTKQKSCCTSYVGDGKATHGDFDSIMEALDRLPATGGRICLLPGVHEARVVVSGRTHVSIHGCGERTKVVPTALASKDALFSIVDSEEIGLCDMDMATLGGVAVEATATQAGATRRLEIAGNRILSCQTGITVSNCAQVSIHDNRMRVLDTADAGVAIYLAAEDAVVERNELSVLPAAAMPPVDIPPGEDPAQPTDPCARLELAYAQPNYVGQYTNSVWRIAIPPLTGVATPPYEALSGMQLAAGAERVTVRENTILGGAGNGISLGGTLATPSSTPSENPPAQTIVVVGTLIMGSVTVPKGINVDGIQFELTHLGLGTIVHTITDGNGGFSTKAVRGTYQVRVTTPGLAISAIKAVSPLFVFTLEATAVPPLPRLAFLYDIDICANRIEGMGLCGVGLAPVAQVGEGGNATAALIAALIGNPVIGLSIRDNRILRCLRSPFTVALRALSVVRGLGGISLGFCENLMITGNSIAENGVSHTDPVCGVFVGMVEEVSVVGNRIVDNGPIGPVAPGTTMQDGQRGGIVIPIAGSYSFGAFLSGDVANRSGARPAARIHENVVDQPAGPALRLGAFGPASITDNHFSSEQSGTDSRDQLAGALQVRNLGGVQFVGASEENPPSVSVPGATSGVGTALPSTGGLKVNFTRHLAQSVLPVGPTLFADNQVRTGATNTSLVCQLLAAYDDASYQNNQACSSRNTDLFIHAVIYGTTVRAVGNRLQDGPETLISLLTGGLTTNVTSLNQGGHCIFATPPDPDRTFAVGNVALECAFTPNQSILSDTLELLSYIQNDRQDSLGQLYAAELIARPRYLLEAFRISAKLGPEAPRTLALAQKAALCASLAEALAIEADIAGIRVPAFAAEDTVVHGRLLDTSVRPIVDTTVRLVTEAGKPLDLPTAKTDASGYYAISLAPDVAAKLESMKVSIAVGEVGTGLQPKAAPRLTLAPGAKILAEVTLTRAEVDTLLGKQRSNTATATRVSTPQASAPSKPDGPAVPSTGRAEPSGRYLGNSATHEVHDMNNVTPRCQVEEIKAEHRAYFKNRKQALEAGYDYCAYFFGKGTSKR